MSSATSTLACTDRWRGFLACRTLTDTDPFVMLPLVEEIPSFRGLRI